MKIRFVSEFKSSFIRRLVRRLPDNQISDKLDGADDQKDDDDRRPDHVAVIHLIAIADGEVAQAAGPDGPGPVSYTHLDVYKRQTPASAISMIS